LKYKLDAQKQSMQSSITAYADALVPGKNAPVPPLKACPDDKGEAYIHLWIRLLFSCLVDADRLDAESAENKERAGLREKFEPLEKLAERFFAHMAKMEADPNPGPVNIIRREVRGYCETAAEQPPGFFSLSVPTGGGKTLSGMAFAFRHALRHQSSRIIYVIPYTSILEQTADTLKKILGPENVIEHHSTVEPENETEQSRLACENWDAPVIVTTNVQFFESLYAAKAGRCRKLHNIVNSVVILDEAQLLPPTLLHPCVTAMKQLTRCYGVTFVLSTATQPAWDELEADTREITPASARLYERLRRVQYNIAAHDAAPISWQDIAGELQKHEQALCVVNTRRDCYDLFRLMPEGTIHLSALMCGQHRAGVIAKIKKLLSDKKPVRVVSTQLVEAGVDIDFPIVYRARAGLDSIAQSAGRCNREGKLKVGEVNVFIPENERLPPLLRKGRDTTIEMQCSSGCNLHESETFKKYFKNFYQRGTSNGKEEFHDYFVRNVGSVDFQFRKAEDWFRLIDDYSRPVIVRYSGNEKLIAALRAAGPTREIMRNLQRYMVNIPARLVPQMAADGRLEQLEDEILLQGLLSYNEQTGLDLNGEIPPETLMA